MNLKLLGLLILIVGISAGVILIFQAPLKGITQKEVQQCEGTTLPHLCYGYWAKQSNDLNICQLIGPKYRPEAKDMCILIVAENKGTELCLMPKFSNAFSKKVCITMVAAMRGDSSLCESSEIDEIRRIQCYESLAEITQNPSYCDKLEFKGECYGMASKEQLFCEDPKLSAKERDNCFFTVTWKRKDLSYCEQIINETSRKQCKVLNKPLVEK